MRQRFAALLLLAFGVSQADVPAALAEQSAKAEVLSHDPIANEQASNADEAFFAEVEAAMRQSIIVPSEAATVWNRKSFSALSAQMGRVAASQRLFRKSATSHTAIFSPNDSEYYDLLAITQYAEGQADPSTINAFGEHPPSYWGIGVWTDKGTDKSAGTVLQVFPGTPADKAGIEPGDRITVEHGAPFSGALTQSTSGTTKFLVKRGDRQRLVELEPILIKPLDFYQDLTENSIRTFEINGRIVGYVRLFSFFRNRDLSWLQDLLDLGKLIDASADVLDLRGGWGGTPISFARPFVGGLPAQTLLGYNDYRRDYNWNYCKPVVAIIDQTTRSGKEIFAKTLQMNGIQLVGQTSAGDVLSTRVKPIRGGEAILELPLADVLIDGKRLEGEGVLPDYPVNSGADAVNVAVNLAARSLPISRPICR